MNTKNALEDTMKTTEITTRILGHLGRVVVSASRPAIG